MPNYMLEVPMQYDTVTRPIVKKLANDILDNFGLKSENMEFVFLGLNETIPTNNSSIQSNRNPLRLESDARVEIEFEEQVVNPLSVAILRQEQRLIFLDEDLRVWMKPVYVETEITLTFRIVTQDRPTASMWLRRAELQGYRQMHTFLTNLEYHYNIPRGFIQQLWVIHTLRERSANPLNENFGQWLKRCFTDKMTMVSNLSGKELDVVITQLQTRVMPWFTFGHEPEKIERKSEAGAWQAEFTVRLHFDRPDGVVMTYPLIIHNQLIPPDYRDDHPDGRAPTDYSYSQTLSQTDMGLFERVGQNNYPSKFASGIPIPHFDDWMHEYQLPHHLNLTRILLTILPSEPTWFFTFTNDALGDYKIKESTMKYMKACQQMLLTPYDSIFNITVHEWYNVWGYDRLNMDEELKLTALEEPDQTKMYHVVVNLLDNLVYLSEEGWEVLYEHGQVIIDWAKELYPDSDLVNIPVNPDGSVDKDLVDKIIDNDFEKGIFPITNDRQHNYYVNGFSVFAKKLGE